MRGQGGDDASGAGLFARRHRTLLNSIALVALGMVTAAVAGALFRRGAHPVDAVLICAGAALAGACAFIHLRHLALSFLVAAAPLPGLLWAAPIGMGRSFEGVVALAYAVAFAVAVAAAQRVLARELDGRAVEPPYRSAGAAAVPCAALALLWFREVDAEYAALQAAADIALSVLSVLLLMPVGVSFLRFDEGFVVHANRARERHQRLIEKVAVVAVPRWGKSIAGISLVFLALSWFGAQPALAALPVPNIPVVAAISCLFVALLVGAVTGGWRHGAAAVIAVGIAALMTLWAATASRTHSDVSPVGALEVAVLAIFLICLGERRTSIHQNQGDDPATARLRALEETGPAQVFGVLGGIAALLPSAVFHPAVWPYAVALLFAGVAGLCFAPALATAVETLLPKRRSVEELYGRR